ncbi:trypsin-like peptidase domain-containing protein [Comamonadaceae bacterium G21597-S1]|nr:trypsin-like peptidase domain-containing protein [Comamonadaceae bacterium G21597-S1]
MLSRLASLLRVAAEPVRVLAVVLLVLAGAGLPPPAAAQKDGTPRSVSPRGELGAEERATIELFEQARDSVVFISTRSRVRDIWSRNVFTVPRGNGSGFIWDESGHVVTNLHVIEGASEASVKLADGRDYRASLVGASPAHDIAVLRINVPNKRPTPVPLGSSHDLKVGQKVFAIGNPFGLDWTLTSGIVSALNRSINAEGGVAIENLVQTDAAVNPGNSGGPLLDSAGRLIGITTAIYSPSGASAGIGFAVPVDTVNRVVPQIIRHGRYIRPTLGIRTDEELNRRLCELLKVRGVVVLRPAPGKPLAGGLRETTVGRDGAIALGDVIVAVEGKPIETVPQLLARLDDFKPGDTVGVTVLRQGRAATLPVTLGTDG